MLHVPANEGKVWTWTILQTDQVRIIRMNEWFIFFSFEEKSLAFNEKLSSLFYLIVPVQVFMHAHLLWALPPAHVFAFSLWDKPESLRSRGISINELPQSFFVLCHNAFPEWLLGWWSYCFLLVKQCLCNPEWINLNPWF